MVGNILVVNMYRIQMHTFRGAEKKTVKLYIMEVVSLYIMKMSLYN